MTKRKSVVGKEQVLRSIKPYWVYLVCEGKKTIEIGKNIPKANGWDKVVYIYCSKDMNSFNRIPKEHREKYRKFLGKVIGKFVCAEITAFSQHIATNEWSWVSGYQSEREKILLTEEALLTEQQVHEYANGKLLYGWHLSDLVVYDKPKELSEFRQCHKCEYRFGCKDGEYSCDGTHRLTRPPQSWCYVCC